MQEQINQSDNVIALSFGPTYTDGGKARIRSRRSVLGLTEVKIGTEDKQAPDLVMDHADPERASLPDIVA